MAVIQPETLAERLGDDSIYVLDIRHEEDFEEWHIPDSTNIDVYEELQPNPETAKEQLRAIPANAEVVTVCAAGKISRRATEALAELGYEAKTLVDGMNGWSRVHRHSELNIEINGSLVQVTRPGKGCLSYVFVSAGEAAVFDPSQYNEVYQEILEGYGAELIGVFDTHAHADHVSGGADLAAENDVPYYLHPADGQAFEPAPLSDGEVHTVGDVAVEVIHTPGHSPGGVTFAIEDEALLTGDTLFHGSVGRVELGVEAGVEETNVEENAETLYESLQRLRAQPADAWILPAHDPGSPYPPVRARLSEVAQRNDDLHRDRHSFIERLASDLPDHPPNFQRVKAVNVGLERIDESELASLELGPNRCAAE